MNGKNWMIGLLGVAALGLVSLPSYAGSGDDVNIQRSTQESVITGDDNLVNQTASQKNRNTRTNAEGNTGNVQESGQVCDTLGNGNACIQDAKQENSSRRTNRRQNQ